MHIIFYSLRLENKNLKSLYSFWHLEWSGMNESLFECKHYEGRNFLSFSRVCSVPKICLAQSKHSTNYFNEKINNIHSFRSWTTGKLSDLPKIIEVLMVEAILECVSLNSILPDFPIPILLSKWVRISYVMLWATN